MNSEEGANIRLGNELARQIHFILYENNGTIEMDEKALYLVLGGRRFYIKTQKA